MRSALLSLLPLALLSLPAVAQDDAGAPPLVAEAAVAQTVSYALDTSKGLVYVKVLKDETTLMSGMSHNHVMRATDYGGTVSWSVDDPSACRIRITVPVDTLDVDPQWLRDQVGYTGKIKDSDRSSIRKNMLDKDQLDSDSYPEISFSSTRCTGSAGSYKVHGNMTIRGQTAPVSALMDIDADGSSFKAAGRLSTTHTAFGFEPFSAMMGALKNRDGLEFFIHVEGSAQ